MTHNPVQHKRRLRGFALVIGAATFALLTLIASLTNPDLSVGISMVCALFLSVFILVGQGEIERARRENTQGLTDASPSEKAFVGFAIFENLIMIALMAGIAVSFSYLFLETADGIHLSPAFYAQLGTYVACAVMLRPLTQKLSPRLSSAGKSLPGQAFYELTPDGFDLHLGIVSLNGPKIPPVHFSFTEITELRVVSFREAKEYLESQTGMTLKERLVAQKNAVTDLYKFLKGQISRPRFYQRIQSLGRTLIIRGADFIYLVSVKNDDCNDLLNAFKK